MTLDEANKLFNAVALLYEGAAYDVVRVAAAVIATTGEYAVGALGTEAAGSPILRRFATASEVLAASRDAMRKSQDAGNKRYAEDTLHELRQCVTAFRHALAALVEVGDATKRDAFFVATRDEVTTALEALEGQTERLELYIGLMNDLKQAGGAPAPVRH